MAPHIPDELLVLIFSQLIAWKRNPHGDPSDYEELDQTGQTTLASLCLSSRSFRAIAQPILYSAFLKRENVYNRLKPDKWSHRTVHQPNERLRNFLRTLLERPDLAAQVKTVQLRAWETETTLDDENMWPDENIVLENARPIPPSVEMARKFYAAAARLLPEGEARTNWQIALCQGDEDAEVALLLALLPMMETLQIVFPNMSMDEYSFLFFHPIFRQAIRKNGESLGYMFTRLKMLEMRSFWVEESEIGLPIYPFSDLFRLPHLETFTAHHLVVEADPEDWGVWHCPPAVSTVKELHLKDSIISSAAIALLMDSCESLRSLDVSFNPGENEGLIFEWLEVGQALYRHQASLESLSIDIYHESNVEAASPGRASPPLGSLKAFTKLRNIRLQQSALVGSPAMQDEETIEDFKLQLTNMLPPSVRLLSVLNATPRLDHALTSLAVHHKQFPDLRRLVVQGDDEWHPRIVHTDQDEDRERCVNSIKGLFETIGVEFVALHRDPDEDDDVDGEMPVEGY